MVFTLWAVIVPFAILVALAYARVRGVRDPALHVANTLVVWWWLAGIPLTIVYWVARVVRLAWRHGSPADRDEPL